MTVTKCPQSKRLLFPAVPASYNHPALGPTQTVRHNRITDSYRDAMLLTVGCGGLLVHLWLFSETSMDA